MIRSWSHQQKEIFSIKRDAEEQFTSEEISDYFGFPTAFPYLLTRLNSGNVVIDCISGARVTDFSLLPAEASWVFTDGLDDSRLSPHRPNSTFQTPTWFQLDADGIWFAKGGFSHGDGAHSYWVGVWRKNEAKPFAVYEGPNAHRWSPQMVTISRDGKTAASADRFGEIHVWEAQTGNQIRVFHGAQHSEIWNVQWNPDGCRLHFGRVSNGSDEYRFNHYGHLSETYDLTQRLMEDQVESIETHSATAPECDLHGNRLTIRHRGQSWHFEEDSFGLPTCCKLFGHSVSGLDEIVFVGSQSGQIAALELQKHGDIRVLRRFHGHHSNVTGLSTSPDHTLLASSSIDGTIRLWSLSNLGKQTGDIDFLFRGNQVLEVAAGSESRRTGILVGDTIVEFGSVSFYESRDLLIRQPYSPGQLIKLGMQRADGLPYSPEFVLQPGPSHMEPLLSLLLTKDNEWVLWSPRGYYDASGNGDRYIGWHENRERSDIAQFYKASQFRKELYRPLIVDKILQLRDPDQAVASFSIPSMIAAPQSDYRESPRLQQISPPVVRIVSPADGFVTLSESVNILAEVDSPTGAPITNVVFQVNGLGPVLKALSVEALNAGITKAFQQRIQLKQGTNTVSVTASTLTSESQPTVIHIDYTARSKADPAEDRKPGKKSTLHVLAIGVSEYLHQTVRDLSYAHKDAEDFARVWKRQQGLQYAHVECKVLTNEQATTDGIREAMESLLNKKPGPDDIVVILFSGHGVYDDRGNYYLATYETEPDKLRLTALPHTEIGHLVTRELAHCRRLLFVDACHSAAAVSDNYSSGDPWMDFGAVVYASSHWREVSEEREEWRHGAMVSAFLEMTQTVSTGDDPAASIVQDGIVTAKDLDFYFHRRIASLTHGRQHSATKWPITISDFPVAVRLSAEKKED